MKTIDVIDCGVWLVWAMQGDYEENRTEHRRMLQRAIHSFADNAEQEEKLLLEFNLKG